MDTVGQTNCLNYPLADDCPDEILCTESEVTELLMTLDIAKASGLDGISARMLRETAEHISPSLTKNFLIYPSRLDHSLHSGKGQTLFPWIMLNNRKVLPCSSSQSPGAALLPPVHLQLDFQ